MKDLRSGIEHLKQAPLGKSMQLMFSETLGLYRTNMGWWKPTKATETWANIVNYLADLIDVPTTVFDLTETTRTVNGEEVRGWECRECGQSCEEMYGSYEYCPHCRRKVDRCEGRDMEKKKKMAMISQPMRGKTDEEILDVRNRIAAKLQKAGYEVADTVFHFTDEQMNELGVKNHAIYYIANSILAMSRCDCVYFAKGWENMRGCRIEHFIAAAYGMEVMYER